MNNEHISNFYSNLIKKFGYNHKSLHFSDKSTQIARYKALMQLFNLENDDLKRVGSSVIDIGCGFCDIYDMIKLERPDLKYTGIDITPECIKIAKDFKKDIEAFVMDINHYTLSNYDFVIASGIISHKYEDKDQHFKIIDKMFDICNIGMSFNFLNKYKIESDDDVIGHDPNEIIKHCMNISDKCLYIEGYLDYDITIMMYKN